MNQLKVVIQTFCCVLLIAFLWTGCNSNDVASTTPAEVKADSSAAMVMGQSKDDKADAITNGYLDTLYTDSASFNRVPKGKLVFVFTFDQPASPTLHGWNAKGVNENGFDSLPDIKLRNAIASTQTYGAGTYFGNIILKRDDVRDIKQLLKTQHARFVLFVPKKSAGEHIYYEILISTDDPSIHKLAPFATMPTGKTANPSPPRSF